MTADGPHPPDDAAAARRLHAALLRDHAGALPRAAALSGGLALLVAATLHGQIALPRLAAWLALLAAVLGVHLALRGRRATEHGARGVHDDHDGDRGAAASAPSRLRRYRIAACIHGLAWGLLALLPPSPLDPALLAALLLAVGGVSVLGMALALSDLRTALLFSLAAALPMCTRLGTDVAAWPAWVWAAVLMHLLALSCLTGCAVRSQRDRQQRVTLLRHVFEHVGVGVGVFDASLRLVACNPRFGDFTGLPEALLRDGTPLAAGLLAMARGGEFGAVEPETEAARRLARLREPVALTSRRVRADGRTIEMRKSPLPGGGLVLVYADASERRAQEARLAENQRMLALLLANTEQGFWFIDNDLRTTDANPAMCRMLGVELPQLLGRTIFDFVDEGNAAVFRRHVAERAVGRAGSYEIALRRSDGTLVDCYNNATPISDAAGNKIGAIGLFSDISLLKRAQAEARRSGELLAQKSHVLDATLQSLAQGVLSVDANGRINAWNRRLIDLLDVPESLLHGQPTLAALVQWQRDHGRLGGARRPLDAGGTRYQRSGADGTVLEVDQHVAADGSLVRTYTDVTARVAAENALRDSETRFRTMADAAPALIWISDRDGAPSWFNQRWLDTSGQTLEEALAADWETWLHPDDRQRCRDVYRAAFGAQRAYEIELRVRSGDGRFLWIADTGVPRFDAAGRFQGYVVYGWDITARKAAEAALIAARDEAERANRAKSEFLSRMSHELRTPMNAVLGFGQLLENDADDALSDGQRARVHEMLRGGRRLLALINDVLDVARIEAGTLELVLTPVLPAGVVDDCLRLVDAAARQRGVAIDVDLPEPAAAVRADAARLAQVLLNLLVNAVRFSPEGGRVRVACRRRGGRLRIEVADGGPGIAPEHLQRLFPAFERLDAAQRGVQGVGSGLGFSRWLVELMHGTIGVDSRLGAGSTFWVELEAAGEAPPTGDAAPPPPLRTVLYVEDNVVNQVLMQGMLAHRPAIRLLLAELPEQGLALAAAERPDLVLLDIQLPGMDGFEVLRRMRLQPALAAVPVLAVSANAMAGDVDEALRAGFDGYVTKPLDLQTLLAAVDRALGLVRR